MLVCVNCNIEYKEDKKFCSYCGGPLVTKDGVISSHKDTDRKEEESGQKLSCPNCKIIYEFGSSCIQCGSALVSEIPTKEKEELKIDHKKTP
jgi:rRNA maturation endonuclease Nob1